MKYMYYQMNHKVSREIQASIIISNELCNLKRPLNPLTVSFSDSCDFEYASVKNDLLIHNLDQTLYKGGL